MKTYGFESVIKCILIRKWKKVTRIQAQKTKGPGGTSLVLGYQVDFNLCALPPEPGSPTSFSSACPIHVSPVCLGGCHGRPGHEALRSPHTARGGSQIIQTHLHAPVLGNGIHQGMSQNLPWMSDSTFILPGVGTYDIMQKMQRLTGKQAL